ncbi:TENM2 [Cordylochernes scorpioides]|uniref:TENM2 n=1 Tax=Cordylochernes scorpioides TaxID=51811 RepID=A0ABY6JZE3_9ARAC|nr:TENM2 [Cordylochernes scorpioides]
MEGCPDNCHGHGECVRSSEGVGEWVCECAEDWEGTSCGVAVERRCSDGRDNDGDGLVDCSDTECCQDPACSPSPLCFTAADPLDILLRKQPPAVTASFFQRMQFLIEEDSVQSYAHKTAFNDRSVAR